MLWLGLSTQVANVVNAMAWVVAVVLCFCLLPRRIRPVAIVIGSLSLYIGYAVGGITDALFVPLLVGAAYKWDRFGAQRTLMSSAGPVLLGLAMAVKQTPWLVLPFVLAGVVIEHRAAGRRQQLRIGGRYLLLCLAGFLLPNLGFIVASPRAWFSGVATPLLAQTVPAGQGLIATSLFLGWGGGSLMAFTAASVLAVITLWIVYVVAYSRMKPLTFLLPSLALLLATRSLGSYLVMLLPAAVVGATTVRPARIDMLRWRARAMAAIASTTCLVVAIYIALATPSPLVMQITSVTTTGQLATVSALTVEATNRSSHPIRPAFSVQNGTTLTTFWTPVSGPSTLRAGQTAAYRLAAPNVTSMPPITGGFQAVAFTAHPASVSQPRRTLQPPTTWPLCPTP